VNGPLAAALTLTADQPERHLEVGDVLFHPESPDRSSVAVLVEGVLRVDVEGGRLADVAVPGSFVGEVGALLGRARTATVSAAAPTTVRIIGDPEALFASHPALALELARQLAGRLHRLTAYLADVRRQFAGSEGHVAMADAVLSRLASRPAIEIDGGSDRAPDY
jgi:CRP-like cAMP-binding protein